MSSMRRLVKLDHIWQDSRKAAYRFLDDANADVAIISTCPFTLDDSPTSDFDIDAAVAKIAAARATDRRP